MTWLRKVAGAARGLWREANVWLKVCLLWIVIWGGIQWIVMDIHAYSPGPYNAPEKVAMRKRLIIARGVGLLIFLGLGQYMSERESRKKQAAEEAEKGA